MTDQSPLPLDQQIDHHEYDFVPLNLSDVTVHFKSEVGINASYHMHSVILVNMSKFFEIALPKLLSMWIRPTMSYTQRETHWRSSCQYQRLTLFLFVPVRGR